MKDARLERLIARPDVIITPHQGFLTKEALTNIAATSFESFDAWSKGVAASSELTGSIR